MAFYPNLTLSIAAIAKGEPVKVFGPTEVAVNDQVHLKFVNGEEVLANLRCNPSEALKFAQQLIDAANSFTESAGQ